MPWRPQGLRNLAWWTAMSPVPVVGIGGVMQPQQLADVAAQGCSAGCVARGVAPGSTHAPQDWLAAWQQGAATPSAVGWPAPSLSA
jgi:hydroxymethylpyrimidine kinase/phosphomethylpyrimidine kinase/thiamine-phosphate diphosphorylase